MAYTENLYSILSELRTKHPKLETESCSGGGGRVDLGILALTDEVWTSDNTDPYDRLTIQNSFTHAYAPGVMMVSVTDSPSFANDRVTSLDYRFQVAMEGSLGVGANLNRWSPSEFASAAAFISDYKTIGDTVQRGSLNRLIQPTRGSECVATEYVALDRSNAVLFLRIFIPVRISGSFQHSGCSTWTLTARTA